MARRWNDPGIVREDCTPLEDGRPMVCDAEREKRIAEKLAEALAESAGPGLAPHRCRECSPGGLHK